MLARNAKIVAISAAVGSVATLAVVATIAIRRRRRKRERMRKHRAGQFLPEKERRAIADVLELAADNVELGPTATKLYRNHLSSISDKRLITLYAAVKVGQYLRESGIDPMKVTADQIEAVKARFAAAESAEESDRATMLGVLDSLDFSEARQLLAGALGVLAQA